MRTPPNNIEINEWMKLVDEYNLETNNNQNYKDIQSTRDKLTKLVIPGINKSNLRQLLFRLYNDKIIPYEAICHCEGKITKIHPMVMKFYNKQKNILIKDE